MNDYKMKSESKANLNIDKERILSLQFKDKVRYMDELIIFYPKLNQILDYVEECHNSAQVFDRPQCMRIDGPSGVGKTTIYNLHKKKYPDVSASDGEYKNVLYSRIPCPAYIGGLASKLLYDLGDPFYHRHGNITVTTHRLYDLLKACGVKIIFLDEVQHLVDRNSQKLIRDSSDWFKELIDETKIPVIFLGMPDSKRIFNENEQLANRVRITESISPFKCDEVRKILFFYDQLLPFSDLSGFADPDMSRRIYLASKGLMKNIHDIITESAVNALQSNSSRITMPMLYNAYNKLFYNNFDDNPFAPNMDLHKVQEKVEQLQSINQVS